RRLRSRKPVPLPPAARGSDGEPPRRATPRCHRGSKEQKIAAVPKGIVSDSGGPENAGITAEDAPSVKTPAIIATASLALSSRPAPDGATPLDRRAPHKPTASGRPSPDPADAAIESDRGGTTRHPNCDDSSPHRSRDPVCGCPERARSPTGKAPRRIAGQAAGPQDTSFDRTGAPIRKRLPDGPPAGNPVRPPMAPAHRQRARADRASSRQTPPGSSRRNSEPLPDRPPRSIRSAPA